MATETAVERAEVVELRLDRLSFRLQLPSDRADEVRSAFADVIVASGQGEAARVVVKGVRGRERVLVNGRSWNPGPNQSLCDQLVYVLLRSSLDLDRKRLHLHAGLVAESNRGLMIGGVAGSGKSTLIAALIESGFDYVSDERVAVTSDLEVSGFPKPLSFVAAPLGPIGHLDPRRTGKGVAGPILWHVPASAIRPGCVVNGCSLTGLIFADQRAGVTTVSRPVHPVSAARRLLADSLDAKRFGRRAMEVAVRLCASLTCFDVTYESSREAAVHVRELLDRRMSPSQRPVEVLASGRRGWRPFTVGPDAVLGLAKGVDVVIAADRALACRQGEYLELDEAHTGWLRALDGRTAVSELVGEAAEAAALPEAEVRKHACAILDELGRLGVVS